MCPDHHDAGDRKCAEHWLQGLHGLVVISDAGSCSPSAHYPGDDDQRTRPHTHRHAGPASQQYCNAEANRDCNLHSGRTHVHTNQHCDSLTHATDAHDNPVSSGNTTAARFHAGAHNHAHTLAAYSRSLAVSVSADRSRPT